MNVANTDKSQKKTCVSLMIQCCKTWTNPRGRKHFIGTASHKIINDNSIRSSWIYNTNNYFMTVIPQQLKWSGIQTHSILAFEKSCVWKNLTYKLNRHISQNKSWKTPSRDFQYVLLQSDQFSFGQKVLPDNPPSVVLGIYAYLQHTVLNFLLIIAAPYEHAFALWSPPTLSSESKYRIIIIIITYCSYSSGSKQTSSKTFLYD